MSPLVGATWPGGVAGLSADAARERYNRRHEGMVRIHAAGDADQFEWNESEQRVMRHIVVACYIYGASSKMARMEDERESRRL